MRGLRRIVLLCVVGAAGMAGMAGAAGGARSPFALRIGVQSPRSSGDSQGGLLREPSHVGNALLRSRGGSAAEFGLSCRAHSYLSVGVSWAREDFEFSADDLIGTTKLRLGAATIDLVLARAVLDFSPFTDEPGPNGKPPPFGSSAGVVVAWPRPHDIRLAADQPDSVGVVRATPRRPVKVGIDLGAEWRFGSTGWSVLGEMVLWVRSHQALLDLETGPGSVYGPASLEYVPSMLRLWISYRP